jgi:hypothetical protein
MSYDPSEFVTEQIASQVFSLNPEIQLVDLSADHQHSGKIFVVNSAVSTENHVKDPVKSYVVDWADFLHDSCNCDCCVNTNLKKFVQYNSNPMFSPEVTKHLENDSTIFKLDSNKIVDQFGVMTTQTKNLRNENKEVSCSESQKFPDDISHNVENITISVSNQITQITRRKRSNIHVSENRNENENEVTKKKRRRALCAHSDCGRIAQGKLI